MSPGFAAFLADGVLVVHMAIAAFNIFALPLTVLGLALGWRIARNAFFRVAHVGCMAAVLFFVALGRYCPLTKWENSLRAMAGQDGYDATFTAHWLERLFYIDMEPRAMVAAYAVWVASMVMLWFLAPPHFKRGVDMSGLARLGWKEDGPTQA